ncbi:hypothetical protein C100_21155 [Sphingobium sp. C100]|nr:hypothetical protein C100_21155 [Sphingobium sp. C100]
MFMVAPIRVLVPIDDSEPEALGVPLGYAKTIAQRKASRTDKVILLTHTKQQLRSTSLERHLGAQVSKALVANKSVSLGDGIMLRHETMQTLRFGAGNSVIIAFYAEDRILEFIDGLSGVLGVVAIPWPQDGAEAWSRRWTPHVHGQAAQAPVKLLSDPVIENGLRALSRMINLAHGSLHPRDKQYADETLRILRAKGHSAPTGDIRSWAIREGWKPGAADDLAKLAEKIFGLKNKPSLSAFHDPNGRYARWKNGGDGV